MPAETSGGCTVQFLGTGNFLAPGRYWNSFVLDGTVLVEPCPTALPHLRRCGIEASAIEVVFVSHFHPDHTFGWPFLLLEFLLVHQGSPLVVVGPPGVERFLADMMELGGVPDILGAAELIPVKFVEVDRSWQQAGAVRFRAVEVDHVDHLECFGYLIERNGRTIGYSGDTKPCPGLDELAQHSDVLILECNGPHPPPPVHMDVESVQALRDRFPDVPFVLTHLGPDLATDTLAAAVVPNDFDTLTL